MQIYLASVSINLQGVTIEAEHSHADLETAEADKLSGEELEMLKTDNIGVMASKISGVNMISTGQNVAKPVIHGLHSNRILVVNNGIRHEFQNWGIEHA
ncbi:MAG: TonB-dependent receptor plug domain-containing protein, partial [Saprospiraceae bacterium]|nr:TonB-dependent receptor plug domain-containing protein [Saprospiraceae bacterium]